MSRPKKDKNQPKVDVAKEVKIERVPKETVLRPHIEISDQRLLLTQSLIAKSFGVGIDAVTRWDVKPVIKRGREALYYLPEVVAFKFGNGEDGAPKLNPQQEKALLDKVRRERAEIELKKEMGEITTISDVEKKLEKELIATRQKLLAIPNRLTMSLRAVDDPVEINNQLTAAIHEALEGLDYGGRINYADTGVDIKNASTAAETQPS